MPATQPSSAVHAVLFDYGLVLSADPDPAAWARMKAVLHADESSFHAAYWRHRHDYDRGALSGVSYWHKVADDLGQSLTEDSLQTLIEADLDLWTQPNQPMIRWAADLQAAGVHTGILSNIGDEMETGIVKRCDWLAGFAHHTFSHRLGIAKPDAAIYAYAAQGLGVAPGDVLFIDDRADNIEAAEQAGMQAVRYTSHDAFLSEMRARGFASLLTPAPKVEATSANPVL